MPAASSTTTAASRSSPSAHLSRIEVGLARPNDDLVAAAAQGNILVDVFVVLPVITLWSWLTASSSSGVEGVR